MLLQRLSDTRGSYEGRKKKSKRLILLVASLEITKIHISNIKNQSCGQVLYISLQGSASFRVRISSGLSHALVISIKRKGINKGSEPAL